MSSPTTTVGMGPQPQGRLRLRQSGELILGRYVIGRVLGRGGFGSVYEVEDRELGLQMAAKEMDLLVAPPGLTGDRDTFLESFRREAVALKRLHHPNIPPAEYVVEPCGIWACVACGEPAPTAGPCPRCQCATVRVEQRHYVLMRFLDGETLSVRLGSPGRAVPWDQVKPWFEQVASAVAELHRNGMLHRDIKPENVLLEHGTNRAFVVDLGLVKTVDPVGLPHKTRILSTKTQAIGTPGYAAPELYRNQPEPASDIFALGMLLYRALTGKDPTDETERHEMLQGFPHQFSPGLPLDVSLAVAKAVKVKPAERFGSVDAMLGALNATGPMALPMPQALPPAAASQRQSWVWRLTVLALATAAAAGGAYSLGVRPKREWLEWVRGTGSLLVQSQPPGARVFRSGHLALGATPLELREQAVGPLHLELEMERYEHEPLDVVIVRGQQLTRLVPLKPAQIAATALPLLPPSPVTSITTGPIVPVGLRAAGKNPQGYDEFLCDKDRSTLIRVENGAFEMGSRLGREDEPPHRVKLSTYFIGKNEVTVRQYHAFCGATGHSAPPPASCPSGDDHPVVQIDWDDANAYCNWAGLRLPTEAEWERAAKKGEYPWGDDEPTPTLANFAEYTEGTKPVGSCPAGISPVGCNDMAGNVWEWCSDWYDAGYYGASPARNPGGPATGTERVARGGGWGNSFVSLRVANRWKFASSYRASNVGFRVAR